MPIRKLILVGIAICCGIAAQVGAALAEPQKIAMLGDSLTEGYGLLPEEGLVPQLQHWLDGQGADVTLINAGVGGDTTAGGAARVAWTLSDGVNGLVVALGGNDALRGIDPAVAKANLENILSAADEAGIPVLLVGFRAPGNFGPDYQTAFDGMYGELAERYGTLLHPAFLAPIRDLGDATKVQALMQADWLHPNADGVALLVESFGPSVLELVAAAGG